MTEKISIVNASNYQIFPGDSQGSMMVEDEFQPDGEEDAPRAKRKKFSSKNIKTEVESEAQDPLADEKLIHIDTRWDHERGGYAELLTDLRLILQVGHLQTHRVGTVCFLHTEEQSAERLPGHSLPLPRPEL